MIFGLTWNYKKYTQFKIFLYLCIFVPLRDMNFIPGTLTLFSQRLITALGPETTHFSSTIHLWPAPKLFFSHIFLEVCLARVRKYMAGKFKLRTKAFLNSFSSRGKAVALLRTTSSSTAGFCRSEVFRSSWITNTRDRSAFHSSSNPMFMPRSDFILEAIKKHQEKQMWQLSP